MVVGWSGWSDWCFASFIYRHAKKLTHIGSLLSRSMSQQRLNLNISINVSLEINLIWIAEPFVTKAAKANPVWWYIIISQSVIYKNWVAVFKVKVTVTQFGFREWNHDYFCYFLLCVLVLYVQNCWVFGDQFSLTVHVHKLECLVKRLLCYIQGQGHSEGSELQLMFFPGQYLWLIKFCMVMVLNFS